MQPRTSSEIRQKKIDFIKENVKDLDTIDPYRDFMKMHKIKRLLSESEFYMNKQADDQVCLTLVLQAQGKPWRRNQNKYKRGVRI